jgi:hypothetical protein
MQALLPLRAFAGVPLRMLVLTGTSWKYQSVSHTSPKDDVLFRLGFRLP